MTLIVSAFAFLRGLQPWHIMVAAFVAWTGIVGVKAYRKGGEAVVERSKAQGKKNEKQAAKAHERARAPGAAERLREQACRDCR